MCVRTQAQDVRQEGRGAGRSLPAGPPMSRAQASGPGTRESRQDSGGHWERAGIVSLAIL